MLAKTAYRQSRAGALGKWLLTVALAITFFSAGAVVAQVLYGAIAGNVTDTSGAVVPHATVTIASQETGQVRTTVTDASGDYRFQDVLPGTYTVAVAKTGSFAAFQEKGVVVEVNREDSVNMVLQPATVNQSVVVTGAPPMLQTQTADVNTEITQKQLSNLPLTSSEGRSFQALYTLIPGAANVREQNSSGANPSRAMSLNVNGMGYNGNTTRIDGAMNYYGWLPYLIAYVPPAESIASVNVVTNSFNAEQGLAGGAEINITTKSGTSHLHGTAWEYYQDAALNARPYTSTPQAVPTVPKNVFNQYGFNLGGPVYIPKVLTGRKKLFFFDNFERTTRRQLITSSPLTIPDASMIGGDFSQVASLFPLLYDPQPTTGTYPATDYVNGYLAPQYRPTFESEYGCNCIPAARISPAAAAMIKNLAPIAQSIGTPSSALLAAQMADDYIATGTLAYNRNTNDAKINWIPNENTQVMGKYSIEPFSILDPQSLGAAGGGAIDGGQPGASQGRIQNVGLGASHVFGPNLLLDFDFGYTRQVTGAQSLLDIADGDYGTDVLKIPGTNGVGTNYVGQPEFAFGTVTSGATSNGFATLGNASAANPFLFRDNQFTGDVNLSWTKGAHATRYGFTYYHFDLNHFQPTSGSYINSVRGGFAFQGGMTVGANPANGSINSINNYNMLADYLLGLPSQYGAGPAVAKAAQLENPNSLRWSEYAAYAQDQWTVTPRLTLDYGVRYELYPPPYRDHTGVYILDPNLPQSSNIEVGGVNGEPEDAGLSVGFGSFVPRAGIAYRIDDKTVIRTGAGLTTDPDSFRFLRDTYPMDELANYTSSSADSIAVTSAGTPMTLATGIPAPVTPNFSSGYVGLPVSSSTTTVTKNFHRGYIESWNLFLERQITSSWVANIGYVGTHEVRQPAATGYLNAGPLPSGSTPCMANGQWNPSTGLTGNCNFDANEIINQQWCTGAANPLCYNTGGISMVEPLFSADYNALQSQLTYHGGRATQLGVVYTYSHAIDFEDNGAGSGSGGLAWNYPAYYSRNRANAGYDQPHNLEIWAIYDLPFGEGHRWGNNRIVSSIVGGWQLNGQFSHVSGLPFSVSANSNDANAPGEPLYADLVAPYKQEGGHAQRSTSSLDGGKPWFNQASFANPTEPTYSATQSPSSIPSPVFGNTNRNEFRGPGVSNTNASLFKGFRVYRESQFQVRFEAINVFNHALLYSNPNTTVGSSAFGYITSFGPAYSPTQGSRSLQFSGRFVF